MTKWNANNYSKQMVIDLKLKRKMEKLKDINNARQEVLPNIPISNFPTPSFQNQSANIRPLSPLGDSYLSSPQYNFSSKINSSANVGDLSLSSIYSSPSKYPDEIGYNPSSRRSSKQPIPQFTISTMEISRIKEENDAMLAGINNTPLQYKSPGFVETE